MQGKIKWFNHAKGFGFVTPLDGSQDAFVHESELSPADLRALSEGDSVEFEIVPGNLGPAAVHVRRVGAVAQDLTAPGSDLHESAKTPSGTSGDVLKFLSQHERIVLGIDSMSEEQKQVLLKWGMHMYSLGQHRVANIEAIKYDGRLIVLDDGSRWEVSDSDHLTASIWSEFEQVVVIEDRMYLLNESESIFVEEEV